VTAVVVAMPAIAKDVGFGIAGLAWRRISGSLREAEVWIAQSETAGKVCRGAGIPEQTYYECDASTAA